MAIDPEASLRPSPFRWNVKHLAILIAAVALSFAAVGVEGTVVALAFCSPAFFAKRGRRLDVLYWMSTCYPFVALLSLYVTWISAWLALGHPPRPSMDDPKNINPIAVPYMMTALFLFMSPFALMGSLGLMVARFVQRLRLEMPWFASCLLITPLSWGAAYGLLVWDPLFVVYWYMD